MHVNVSVLNSVQYRQFCKQKSQSNVAEKLLFHNKYITNMDYLYLSAEFKTLSNDSEQKYVCEYRTRRIMKPMQKSNRQNDPIQ